MSSDRSPLYHVDYEDCVTACEAPCEDEPEAMSSQRHFVPA
jgi:hypothetical protein